MTLSSVGAARLFPDTLGLARGCAGDLCTLDAFQGAFGSTNRQRSMSGQRSFYPPLPEVPGASCRKRTGNWLTYHFADVPARVRHADR